MPVEYTRPALFLLFFLSGGCGLICQVVWMRMLGFVLGRTVLAVSRLDRIYGGVGPGKLLLWPRCRSLHGRPQDLRLPGNRERPVRPGHAGLLQGLSPVYIGLTRLLCDFGPALSLARFNGRLIMSN